MLARFRARRSEEESGATLVEFAVVFPLLLLLIFGVVDFARLITEFVSVSTASREGARYGTAVGGSPPQYVDCSGIKQAALDKIVLGGVTNGDIYVFWDEGPADTTPADPLPGDDIDATGADYACDGYGGLSAPTEDDIASGTRVVVIVDNDFNAITPIIGQFLGTVEFQSRDARTIFKGVLGG